MVDTGTPQRYPRVLIATLLILAVLTVVNLLVNLRSSGLFNESDESTTTVVPRIAFVTGGVDPFWNITIAGARDAAERHEATLEVHVPDEVDIRQDEILLQLADAGVDGVAISPLHPVEQVNLLDRLAATVPLVTFDSDAPGSRRLCYMGTDNYAAGWLCGEMIGEALPGGGRILISIGSLAKDNGRKRRQGLIDRLLGRDYRPGRASDPPSVELVGPDYTVVATVMDDNNAEQARANARQALATYPDINCIAGLFGYSGPSVIDALREAGEIGQITVVAFDDHDATLQAIESGEIYATIVQDAYEFGYAAVQALAALARQERRVPMPHEMLFPCRPVKKSDLDEFIRQRRDYLGNARRPPAYTP